MMSADSQVQNTGDQAVHTTIPHLPLTFPSASAMMSSICCWYCGLTMLSGPLP